MFRLHKVHTPYLGSKKNNSDVPCHYVLSHGMIFEWAMALPYLFNKLPKGISCLWNPILDSICMNVVESYQNSIYRCFFPMIPSTLSLFEIAVEHSPLVHDLLGFTWLFSVAMSNNQRVNPHKIPLNHHFPMVFLWYTYDIWCYIREMSW